MLYFLFILFCSFSKLSQCVSNHHWLGVVRTVGRDYVSKARSTGRDVKLSVDRGQYERGFCSKPISRRIVIYCTMVIYYGHKGTILSASNIND